MPQLKQSAKRLRQSIKRGTANKQRKDEIEYYYRQFKKVLESKDEAKITEISKKLIQLVDKAAKRNIFKKNTAARKKSQIMKKVNAKPATK